MKKNPAKPAIRASMAAGYAGLLAEIKQRIRAAQVGAAMSANAGMLMLYWEIGGVLVER